MYTNHFSKTLLPVGLALAFCGAMLQGATLVQSPVTTITISCDTVLGPAPAVNVGIVLGAAGTLTVTPTVTGAAAAAVVAPAAQSVTSTTVATNFAFRMAAGCKGGTNGQTVVLNFTPSAGTALTINATLAITNTATALATSPSPVIITCQKAGAVYTPGSSVTVNVTSAANFGTPFTVDNTVTPLPSWLSVTPLTGGTASATPVGLTVVAAAGCGALPVGSTTFNVHLLNAPAPDKLLPVTIQIGAASPLSATVTQVALTYTKASEVFTPVTSNISATPAAFFTVDPTSLPLWLTVTPASGTTSSPVTLSFAPTSGADTLALGSYSATVHLKVSGSIDFLVPVTLTVQAPTAVLTVAEGNARSVNWTLGTSLPVLVITPVSSSTPIPFTVSVTNTTLFPQVGTTSGIAYTFGSPFTVTFLQSVFGGAAPGATLSGTVTITPQTGSAINVVITVHVLSPGATITSLSPSSIPTASSGTFTVAISGSGFANTGGATLVTNVGVVANGFIVADPNLSATVVNANTIILLITVPTSSDPYLPFSGTGGTVTIGVCNPNGTSCSTPTGTQTLTIGVNPIIQAVTSASSYLEATPPALTPVAPYDILAVFGVSFCNSSGNGCTGPTALLFGVADPVTSRYPTTLSPDPVSATQRLLNVAFQTHAATPVLIANAPLLFGSDGQINLIVPDATRNFIGSTVDIVVSFGYGSGATLLKSAPYSITIAATNPGIFTLGGDGIGPAAALSSTYTLITNAAPAGARNPSTDSDVVQLYVTGFGKPDSTLSGTGYSATCIAPDSYFALVNAATGASLTSDDGLVIQSALLPSGDLPPCIKANSVNVPQVTIGGVAATIQYAGWVASSVAGLYQINVQMPASNATFTDASGSVGTLPADGTILHLPVVIQAPTGKFSQAGVTLSVAQSLLVTPSGQTTGPVNVLWTGTQLTASDSNQGSPTYAYTVTSGSLPAGLSLTGATGAIAGTPTATGNSTVVFTATDQGGVTGTVSITFMITP